jgi:peptidoglycan hydrolase-like protein with peptidoglycan-binding domain
VSTVHDARTAPPVTDAELAPDEPRRRRRSLVWLGLGAILIAAGAGAWLWAADRSTRPAPATTAPVATAVVERGTISATESWDGTLDHGAPFTVAAQGAGTPSEPGQEGENVEQGQATITRLPEQGETVTRGEKLYWVNERPVTLLLGAIPMYRDLAPGASGSDVKQLEANLAKLGYGGFTADNQYTSSTAAAVRDWQDDIGAEVTGVVPRASVVFLPERGQVDSLQVGVGDAVSPGTPILDITGTAQVVSLEADVDDRDLLEIGTEMTVLLPGGDKVAGTVSATAVVEAAPEEGAEPAAGTEPIVQAEVALNKSVPEEFVGGPVDVVVAVDRRTDVLFVPVNALLALTEGGYGLEVVGDDGNTSIVPVDTGLFGEGKVEIKSADIAEGTVVGVAGR